MGLFDPPQFLLLDFLCGDWFLLFSSWLLLAVVDKAINLFNTVLSGYLSSKWSRASFLVMAVVSISGGGGTPYNYLYREALPERGTFYMLLVYKRVGI